MDKRNFFELCKNNNNRASWRNQEKLENAGLEQGFAYDLGNNITVTFFAGRNGIAKVYKWGKREITEETAARRAGGVYALNIKGGVCNA